MNTADAAARPAPSDPLAGLALRSAPPAQVATDAPTSSPWSYEQTLDALRRWNASLVVTDGGVRLVDRRRPPAALARAVAAHGPALGAALRLGVLDGSTPAGWCARDWPEETRLHAAWFGLTFSPSGPVELGAGRRVTDFARFRQSVAARLAAGPAAPGADALAADLAALFGRFGPAAASFRVLRTPRPLAA